MALLRGESVTDYNFVLWVEYLTEQGYDYETMSAIINCGKRLPKYGNVKLAIGDLIDCYEKETEDETKPIDWTEFFRILKIYEKKAMGNIIKLMGKHITTEDYFKHKEYLENQFAKHYGGEAE